MGSSDRVVRFGDAAALVGILTEPGSEHGVRPSTTPGVILLNAGTLHRIGPHRLYVRISRQLAAAGFPVLRFDFSGLGDSPPRRDNLAFEEFGPREARQAMDFLSGEIGVRRFVLMGLCGGAHVAVQVAAADPRVVGAAVIDWYAYRTVGWRRRHWGRVVWRDVLRGVGPFWDGVRRLLGSRSRPRGLALNDGAVPPLATANAQLRAVLERQGRLFFLYTGALRLHYNHVDQLRETFPDLWPSEDVEVALYSDADHTLTLRYYQDRLIDALGVWMAGFAATDEAAHASGTEITGKALQRL